MTLASLACTIVYVGVAISLFASGFVLGAVAYTLCATACASFAYLSR